MSFIRKKTEPGRIKAYQAAGFSDIAIHFADFMGFLAGYESAEVELAALLVSQRTSSGHICVDIHDEAGNEIAPETGGKPIRFPEAQTWIKALETSPVTGKPGDFTPMILDDRGRLYLHRYFGYQQKLAQMLKIRAEKTMPDVDDEALKKDLDLFFKPDAGAPDWQKAAAFTALVKQFCVISGGPGTGKTTTVAKILALLVKQAGRRKYRIALAAPTGKAAARLQESIKEAKASLMLPDDVREQIPESASTIHRLLGTIPGSAFFRHNSENRLAVDAVVIDEASMVDLALMSKLVQALPEESKLVLLGDRYQLASVEAGAVMGDICDLCGDNGYSTEFSEKLIRVVGGNFEKNGLAGLPVMADAVVELKKSYRFDDRSGIGAVSREVNAGRFEPAFEILSGETFTDVSWRELSGAGNMAELVETRVVEWFRHCMISENIDDLFDGLDRFRILCAVREGPFGVKALNALVEKVLKREKLIDPEGRWYAKRPVMITANDYQTGLFNGDIGIVLPDPDARGELKVFFRSEAGEIRKLSVMRIGEHETVYAMTVHKSQGSEFDDVLFVMPDRDAPVLTRELVYTGITRAKKSVQMAGTAAVFSAAVKRRTRRSSGLRDALI